MDIKILKLEAPYEYIYCNGEIGKHIATYIVGDARIDESGEYQLETHSHPIVKYWNAPQGVVWNKAELRDCEVLCDDTDKRIDPYTFSLLFNEQYEQEDIESTIGIEELKEKLKNYGISFKPYEGKKRFEIGLEVGKCNEGYFVQPLYPECLIYFNFTEPTLEELAAHITEERKDQEEFFDNQVQIVFTPESTLAMGFVENL